jgi:hypothetical protein
MPGWRNWQTQWTQNPPAHKAVRVRVSLPALIKTITYKIIRTGLFFGSIAAKDAPSLLHLQRLQHGAIYVSIEYDIELLYHFFWQPCKLRFIRKRDQDSQRTTLQSELQGFYNRRRTFDVALNCQITQDDSASLHATILDYRDHGGKERHSTRTLDATSRQVYCFGVNVLLRQGRGEPQAVFGILQLA